MYKIFKKVSTYLLIIYALFIYQAIPTFAISPTAYPTHAAPTTGAGSAFNTPTPVPITSVEIGPIRTPGSPLNILPKGQEDAKGAIRTQFNTLVSTLLGWATIIGALFFLIQIFLGGYAFITAGGDTGKVAEGRQRIINGLIGLIIVVSAYAIAGLIANLLQIPIYNPLIDELFLSPLTPTPAP